jgi:hypothetical protein
MSRAWKAIFQEQLQQQQHGTYNPEVLALMNLSRLLHRHLPSKGTSYGMCSSRLETESTKKKIPDSCG